MTATPHNDRHRIGLAALLAAFSVVALGLGWWATVGRLIEDAQARQAAERAAADAARDESEAQRLIDRAARIRFLKAKLSAPFVQPDARQQMRDELTRLGEFN